MKEGARNLFLQRQTLDHDEERSSWVGSLYAWANPDERPSDR